jgi:endogenous inhibitor of DNA gyrase (YacG/DUF329 family)
MSIVVNCPNCKKQVQWLLNNRLRPFCSKTCQLIDLGEWVDEQKSIAGTDNLQESLLDLPDIEDIEALLSAQPTDFFKQ